MDVQTLRYFLAVTREGNISAAAEALHVAQPSLSRRMKELEEELGVRLFQRGNRRITRTREGAVLQARAEELVQLMDRTKQEVTTVRGRVTGAVRIGAGESRSFRRIAEAVTALRREQPGVTFQIVSGDTADLMDQLSGGQLDFALIFTAVDWETYQSLRMPDTDSFGVLMRRDDPLAARERLTFDDLYDRELIFSRVAGASLFPGVDRSRVQAAATYNLLYTATHLVESGLGLALCYDGLADVGEGSPLTFRPLDPPVNTRGVLIWKRHVPLSPAAALFIETLRRSLE